MSQPSPQTTNWQAVAATYRSPAIPVERVVQELWRAAQSNPETNWRDLLSTPVVLSCLNIAAASADPAEALALASREIGMSRQSTLAADVAKRAVVQAIRAENRVQAFTQALFSEASNYLVSRDLPGYIGAVGRNKTVGEAIEFKDAVRARVREVVGQVPAPEERSVDRWRAFVNEAASRLTRR